jgi:hypothetical protein
MLLVGTTSVLTAAGWIPILAVDFIVGLIAIVGAAVIFRLLGIKLSDLLAVIVGGAGGLAFAYFGPILYPSLSSIFQGTATASVTVQLLEEIPAAGGGSVLAASPILIAWLVSIVFFALALMFMPDNNRNIPALTAALALGV